MQQAPHYRSARAAMVADVGRAIAMTTSGTAAFAASELVLTWIFYTGPVPLGTAARLVALTGTLALWLWLWLTLALVAVMLVARLASTVRARRAARGVGWFVAAPTRAGVRPGVPWLWAALLTGAAIAVAMQRVGVWALAHYKEPQLTAGLIAAVALPVVALAAPLCRALHAGLAGLARVLAPRLRGASPLGRWRAAGLVLAALLGGALGLLYKLAPQARSTLPLRHIAAAVIVLLGMGLGAHLHSTRPPRFRRRDRRVALAGAAAAWALLTLTLWQWGGDLEAKYMAKTASPALDSLIDSIRYANDLDRDGYGSLLGENDCAPFDSKINPDAKDIPDDGIDQNCDGHDFTLTTIPVPAGDVLPVPAPFKKEWNVLFLTVDATRYDSTTFGGSLDLPKHRDTTPRLAELVKKSTSFTFCNAPSAGTMASIPAIITSKYFHDGIALDDTRPPGVPPKILPENTTLPEIMKRAGYHTGVIASHEYWNDWGLDQGVDDYDNSIGKTPDPWRSPADKVTDHILAYISRQHGKWFMWAHYIDPHGRYVAHPDVVDWDGTEPDRYDAELRWTDQQIGRLLDELRRMGVADTTLLVITSDHGDSMGEHQVPLGTHGTALYRELQHVPMIFYIPENPPHLIGGAVTNLDIVPTLADLLGIDVHDLTFEGRSLVPAIFYGKEDHERIVFAETNAPNKQRAAISESWKLIHYFSSNVDELFDLKADPWEHTNLASKKPPAFAVMKGALDAWLERVMFSRDPKFNQALAQLHDVLLTARPAPQVPVTGQTFDGGHLEVIGLGLATEAGNPIVPEAKTDVHVYYTAHARSEVAYRIELVAWPVDTLVTPPTTAVPPTALRIPPHLTGDGAFATDRWRPGEYVRDRFALKVPATWHGAGVAFGLVVLDAKGAKELATGPSPAGEPDTMYLGVLPLAAPLVAPLPAVPGGGSGSGSSAPTRP